MRVKYLMYFLLTHESQIDIDRMKTGISDSGLNLTHDRFATLKVPLAPINEQRRIVAKIEELFSELDKGVEALTTAREQLTAYRQSVLKHAFEGKLTKDWRNANAKSLCAPDGLEAELRAKQVLQQKTDLESWERSVSEWGVRGDRGKKPSRPEPYGPATLLPRERVDERAELPKGWSYFTVTSLCGVVRGGSPRPAGDPKYYGGKIPFLKVADLTRTPGMKLSTHTYTITEAGLIKTRQTPPNTLLISNSGATLGVPKICTFETTFNDGIAAFLGLPPEYIEYLYYFWESKTNTLRSVNQGAAQPNLNTSILGEMPVPMCSSNEAYEVVRRLEVALETGERLLFDIDERLAQAEALRQSILKKAFSGQLVAQDPKDEPASALLERIHAERESTATKKKQRNSKNGKNKADDDSTDRFQSLELLQHATR